MKNTLRMRKKKREMSEREVDKWANKVDLSKGNFNFEATTFPKLKPTDWDSLYDELQKSKPISIRLPVKLIHHLKQIAIQKGIAYQTLIRLWLSKMLKYA